MNRKLLFMALFVFAFIASVALTGCFGGDETGIEPMGEEEPPAEAGAEDEASEPEGATEEVDPSEITDFSQSPILDDKDLPPVEERLPNEPKLTNEISPDMLDYEIGSYGGTLRTVTNAVDWNPDVFMASNEALINTPNILGEEFTPNVVQDYEVTDDQQEFTFYMREGLKWSDGEPVTTEDVRFTVEDVIFNEELTPIFPSWLRAGGDQEAEPMEFEVIDEYTFKISFEEPYGGLIARIAIQGWRGYSDLLKPSHYLKDYHVDYIDLEDLEPLIEEEGFEEGEWENLFNLKDIENWDLTNPDAIGFPVLYPWMIVSSTEGVAEFERNPYYFKVDAEGNQLPYIDSIRSTLVQDMEMIGMETISGNVDFLRESTALNNMPLYRENEENGGYRALLNDMHIAPADIHLNLTYEDEVWREVVRDKRFRQALNLAIDKEEVVEAIYYGFAEPSAMIDSTFDPEEANRLLDEMGMEVGSDGYRVGPDGETFNIDFEIGEQSPEYVSLTELVVEYWSDLDLNVSMRTIDRTLWGQRNQANELQASVMWTVTPLWYYMEWGEQFWAPLWKRWWDTNGEEGEEPPEEAKRFYETMNEFSTSSPEEAHEVVERLREEVRENLWFIQNAENVQQPLIVNEKLGNVPDEDSGVMAIGTNYSVAQLFFKE